MQHIDVMESHAVPSNIPTGKLAMWWFLSSEIITFGGLIGTYIIFRLGNMEWAEAAAHLSVPVGTCNTLVLLTSSLTMVLALAAVEEEDRNEIKKWLSLTVFLGVVFLVIKAFEWGGKIGTGLTPDAGGFWSFYYALTGLHALHVLVGVLINAILLVIVVTGRLGTKGYRIELAGLYWHFVDVVWIFLFPLLYLS
jgi:heme/copper-type cytochrome/quinol oxidase subunit 3